MLQDMFGEDSVPKMFKGEKLYVTVNDTRADIDLSNLVSIAVPNIMKLLEMLCVVGSYMCCRRNIPTNCTNCSIKVVSIIGSAPDRYNCKRGIVII